MELLFRGFHECENGTKVITIDRKEIRGKWIEGCINWQWDRTGTKHFYIGISTKNSQCVEWWEVIPCTVGQFIGLRDKNGNRIFKGDKVRILYTDWISQSDYSISLEDYLISISSIGIVDYKGCEFILLFNNKTIDSLYEGEHGRKEVIGTMFDKEEL